MSSEWSSDLFTLLVYLPFLFMLCDSVGALCHRLLRHLPSRIYHGLLVFGMGLAVSIAVEATWLVTLRHPPNELRVNHLLGGLVAITGFVLILAWVVTWLWTNRSKVLAYIRHA